MRCRGAGRRQREPRASQPHFHRDQAGPGVRHDAGNRQRMTASAAVPVERLELLVLAGPPADARSRDDRPACLDLGRKLQRRVPHRFTRRDNGKLGEAVHDLRLFFVDVVGGVVIDYFSAVGKAQPTAARCLNRTDAAAPLLQRIPKFLGVLSDCRYDTDAGDCDPDHAVGGAGSALPALRASNTSMPSTIWGIEAIDFASWSSMEISNSSSISNSRFTLSSESMPNCSNVASRGTFSMGTRKCLAIIFCVRSAMSGFMLAITRRGVLLFPVCPYRSEMGKESWCRGGAFGCRDRLSTKTRAPQQAPF